MKTSLSNINQKRGSNFEYMESGKNLYFKGRPHNEEVNILTEESFQNTQKMNSWKSLQHI